ncbi:uncharacterized protein AMSG_00125 [Thecamonas trahens ATCC 50062]|uniref:Gamma-secretase subunit PEN-2 n=1 Tax=Thecamonas trahens ATCC 50062 TaxID=461836 RepID=A0A0L0D186_THETB|nr:hypothetical protein AMSG_00125 [Thecamonas trahens ATCC 50062]KNC46007.1 hypothetical protein AMSG_00125 [Thecamonas trahens ATCC 50062]|eukprot:XP_013762987.1 hypothetical protein AMSG_00125 [Thecamonas trahens ATCC 50062]
MFQRPSLTVDQRVAVCRKYFIAGLCFMPLAWMVNIAYFWEELRHPRGHPKIKRYVMYSAVGSVVYMSAFFVWLAIYLTSWRSWGATGDNISIYVPAGDPK